MHLNAAKRIIYKLSSLISNNLTEDFMISSNSSNPKYPANKKVPHNKSSFSLSDDNILFISSIILDL